ncbi:MAG: molybdopterin-dependent oxidoreductase [Desulfobacteraceae bacterium]|uniref:Molybdopterin-dependent oxidoreductase n=1 Tax=Candidatus Desulfacyla euxinica TaxID=2841693 RepID=A0A8J6MZU2_9DELT|nr:molybdopterin-dependent oxidoreductase [Candidatus Desulfacyla euxinica]MBL6979127.1 molybdopterin-dependent oxidoreductase [Desulfobacteraceae bacterium]MBL7216592.1 molybdopterin-dependent oxidoreductase [Desulfobacteraceae bacterium]
MDEISMAINGIRVSCPPGITILEAAEQNGIKIPKLCYHPDLKPFGACRLCLIEEEKNGRVMASCVTPVAAKMEVLTDSPRVIRHRKNIVRLMMAEHPESCVVCSKGNRCQLRGIAAEMGLGETGLYPIPNYKSIEQANPFIVRDLSKCILCGKCIRADHELVVAGAIDYNLRGFKSRPATLYDLPLEGSNCTFCGTCVSICPTGALSPKTTGYVGTPEKETLTSCGFCGVGCSILMGVADDRAVEINPSGLNGSVNGATLCVRGHFAHDFLNSKERLTQPMIRGESDLKTVSWDEALDRVASRLLAIKKDYGPQSIGFFGSSKCTNEENYLFQKMARVLFGTNNLDNGGSMAGRPALQIIDEKTDGRSRINPLANLEKAEVICVLGADPCQSAPVLSYYLKRAAKRGVPLIGIDPRKTDLFPFSTLWLAISPDKDYELINCLAAMVWKKFAHDSNFIERFTEEFNLYTEALSSFNPERLCLASGLDMKSLAYAADLVKGKKISFVVGHGITQQKHGARSMEAILNLSLMTGSLGCESGGLYVITKENNQVGAWDMGTVPDALPGRIPLGDGSGRGEWERAWDVKISPDQGLNVVRMLEEAEKGNLKALYIMGENPLRSLPQHERVEAALKHLDLLVVQDILDTETTRIADVVLPGAAFSEKGGSFTNMEGRIVCFTQVVPPPRDGKPDWEILDLLGLKMGYPKAYRSLERIRAEMVRLIPMYAGLQETPGDAWTWIRRTETEKTLRFSPLQTTDQGPMDDDYPLTAILGSQRFHLGGGTRTGISKRIKDFGLKGEVSLSSKDGARLHVKSGDTVHIQSREGALIREARIDEDLNEGQIFVPTAFHKNDAMNLVGLSVLGSESSQGLKTCQVRVEKLEGSK